MQDVGGAVGLNGVGSGEAGDGHVVLGQAGLLRGLQLAGKGGGVVADDQVDVGMGGQHGLADGDGLLSVLLGVVVVGLDVLPVGILLLDDLLALHLPGVLVGDGGLGVVPAVLHGVLVGVHAAGLQALDGQVHQHLAQNLGGALGDHQSAVAGLGIGVPGRHGDARGLGGLEGIGHAGGVHSRDTDGVHALGDGVVDALHLVGHSGVRGADVVHGDAPVLGELLGAGVGHLKEGVAADFGDEGHGLALDGAARRRGVIIALVPGRLALLHRGGALGSLGLFAGLFAAGGQGEDHAQGQKQRYESFHFHVFIPP